MKGKVYRDFFSPDSKFAKNDFKRSNFARGKYLFFKKISKYYAFIRNSPNFSIVVAQNILTVKTVQQSNSSHTHTLALSQSFRFLALSPIISV